MDFGLDKLIEMIEERFGRRVGTVVLAAVGIGAFSFAVHAFFAYLVFPAIKYAPEILGNFGNATQRLTVADAIYGAIQISMGLLGVAVFLAVSARVRRWHRRETAKVLAQTHEIITDCEAYTERNHAKLEAMSKHIEKELAEMVAQAREDAIAIIQNAEKRAAEITASNPSHPSPQGTGEGTPP